MNRTTWSWINATFMDCRNETRPYTFSIDAVGLWNVQFLLYRDGALSEPQGDLQVFVTVS